MTIKYSQVRRQFFKSILYRVPSCMAALIGLPWGKRLLASTMTAKVSYPGEEALASLIKGNEAFVKALGDQKDNSTSREIFCQQLIENKITHQKSDFIKNRDEQKPKAIIIGCSDSRVSPEIVFDQGIGDLFVIRIAGNIIENTGHPILGSIEYAVNHLNVRLIIILGHQKCGAVTAALEKILNPLNVSSKTTNKGNKGSQVVVEPLEELISVIKHNLNENEIEKTIVSMNQSPGSKDKAIDKLMELALQKNVTSGVNYITQHEKFIPYLKIKGKEKLLVKGAIYSFESGKVDFI